MTISREEVVRHLSQLSVQYIKELVREAMALNFVPKTTVTSWTICISGLKHGLLETGIKFRESSMGCHTPPYEVSRILNTILQKPLTINFIPGCYVQDLEIWLDKVGFEYETTPCTKHIDMHPPDPFAIGSGIDPMELDIYNSIEDTILDPMYAHAGLMR